MPLVLVCMHSCHAQNCPHMPEKTGFLAPIWQSGGMSFSTQHYAIQPLPPIVNLNELQAGFADLPEDHYTTGGFRFRRLSRFRGSASALIHMPQQSFVQDSSLNELLGDIRRDYAEMDAAVYQSRSFMALIGSIEHFFAYDPQRTVLGVHQIRIIASSAIQGLPAPEGIHQDGFDFIVIACINRHQVTGAITKFYADPHDQPCFAEILQPGSMAFVNDRALYHYTGPIQPSTTDGGFRDVFVITVRTGVSV